MARHALKSILFLWSFGGQQAIPITHSQCSRSTGITPALLQLLLHKQSRCCEPRQTRGKNSEAERRGKNKPLGGGRKT